jgi:hypothetical protein
MRWDHKMMEDQEDAFWADDGVYEQIGARVTEYIKANRKVDEVTGVVAGMSFKELEEVTRHKVGQYRDYVSYSAYTDDYTDNLDEVAVEGRVQFIEEVDTPNDIGMVMGDVPYETRENYISPVMENPTWLEVALLANDMINCTGDNHHVFLEGIRPSNHKFSIDEKSFVKVYRFSMGS